MFGWLEDAWDFIKGVGSAIWSGVKWFVQRFIGIVDFLLTLLGIMPAKKIRIEAKILVHEDRPLADRDDVQAVVDLADEVFRDEMNVRVVSRDGISHVPEAAPPGALDVDCGLGIFGSLFSRVGAFFRKHMARTPAGTFFGYGAPVTVFVVRNVKGKRGCSPGFLADYVVIDPDALSGAEGSLLTLAHEVGHACDLVHAGASGTLMQANHEGRPRRLKRIQKAIFRSSPHVTYR